MIGGILGRLFRGQPKIVAGWDDGRPFRKFTSLDDVRRAFPEVFGDGDCDHGTERHDADFEIRFKTGTTYGGDPLYDFSGVCTAHLVEDMPPGSYALKLEVPRSRAAMQERVDFVNAEGNYFDFVFRPAWEDE